MALLKTTALILTVQVMPTEASSTVLREPSCECERGRPGEATNGSDWAWGATPTVGSRSEPARRAQTLAVVRPPVNQLRA